MGGFVLESHGFPRIMNSSIPGLQIRQIEKIPREIKVGRGANNTSQPIYRSAPHFPYCSNRNR